MVSKTEDGALDRSKREFYMRTEAVVTSRGGYFGSTGIVRARMDKQGVSLCLIEIDNSCLHGLPARFLMKNNASIL